MIESLSTRLLAVRSRALAGLRRRALRWLSVLSEWFRRQPDVEAALIEVRPKPLAYAVVHSARARFGPVDGPGGFPQVSDGRRIELDAPLPTSPTDVRCLRRAEVVDVPREIWSNPAQESELLALGRAGVPLALRGWDHDAANASAFCSAVGAIPSGGQPPAIARELRSIAVRRAAWSARGDADAAAVSVLLASMRADLVLDAAAMVGRQDYPAVQLVVGLHGDGFEPAIEREIARRARGDVVVRRVTGTLPLGTVLQTLVEAADGEILTKWDDDDWYGISHLTDLVLGLGYSGAELVGKTAEFVYLEGPDVTIRRFALGAERESATLAGGTLALSADALRSVGGWAAEPRSVDQLLIRAVRDGGGTTYRTHGFQYVLRRSAATGRRHTWGADDGYFIGTATDQWQGLALEPADIARPVA